MDLTDQAYEFIFSVIKKRSGISLSKEKAYLLDSRLLPIVKCRGLNNVKELIDKIKNSNNEHLISEVVEAMTTNESSFFRDSNPFTKFNELIVPYVLEKNPNKDIRIWSAAASTGQEAYTIAISLSESFADKTSNFNILATDISPKVLEKAREGVYSQFEVQRGLPVQMLLKYFDQVDRHWKAKDDLRSKVEFKEQNLIEGITNLGKFDIIFCRNVLIYFDRETKIQVLSNIAKMMDQNSILFLGSSEGILGVESLFEVFEGCNGIFKLKSQ
jgi:chemotaxis protein methyltransferase CheR